MDNAEDMGQTFEDMDQHEHDGLVSMAELDAYVDEHTVSATATTTDIN
jgi:hypothetical protein